MYENNNFTDYTKPNNANSTDRVSDGYHYSGNYGSTYQTGSGSGYDMNKTPKQEKKKKAGFFKKALVTVSLGLFFGICAGLGFFAVNTVTDALIPKKVQSTAVPAVTGNLASAADQTQQAGAGNEDNLSPVMDVSKVVTQVMPSIVSINNTFTQTMMSYFGQSMSSEATAAGSGIIVGESDTELLVVTNYHVVENADKLMVQFVDGTEAEAQMKGSDASMDLAVIAISLAHVESATKGAIAVASLGDSDSLTVGEPAIAIGNSLGYGQSVTTGVISALDRIIGLSDETKAAAATTSDAAFIQTDAAINPGNSGGALLNMKGEVIGINSNKIGGSVIEGMGYAIPISAAKPIIEDLMLKQTRAKVTEDKKGYLGISPLTVVDEMAEVYGMPKGVYVSQVFDGTAAQTAGIVKGNIITEFDGNKISSSEELLKVMDYYSKGDMITVTIMQGSPEGWEAKTVTVTLGEKTQ